MGKGEKGQKETLPYATPGYAPEPSRVKRFRLTRVEGAEVGKTWDSSAAHCSVGSDLGNDLVLDDDTVSRFHCEVDVAAGLGCIRDCGSRNGVIVDGVRVKEAYLRDGSLIRLGRQVLRFDFMLDTNPLLLSERTRLGSLIGNSVAMRACFALLERAADSDVTVLIEGETGTGKSQAAQVLHEQSGRRDQPFMIVDCSAITENLLESELFGHAEGSYTGAYSDRIGAFEEADGGTVFLDEIGELPLELQPKLLRVLENRQIRRVGSNGYKSVNIRLIAATNRDLRAQVNEGSFRSDLFFRLAVVRIRVPPLRQRPEDLKPLAEHLLSEMGVDSKRCEVLLSPQLVSKLQQAAWPGNIRELRNYLQRCIALYDVLPTSDEALTPNEQRPFEIDPTLSLLDVRNKAKTYFEPRYLRALLERCKENVTEAAKVAGIDRVHLHRLLRRYGIKRQRPRNES